MDYTYIDLGKTAVKVNRVSLEYFTRHVLPPLPPLLDTDAVIRTLKRQGISNRSCRPFAKNGRWRGFASKSPADGDRTKNLAFKSFPSIVDAICKAATLKMHGVGTSMKFVQKPHEDLDQVEGPGPDQTLPDAYTVPRETDNSTEGSYGTMSTAGRFRRSGDSDAFTAVRRTFVFDEL